MGKLLAKLGNRSCLSSAKLAGANETSGSPTSLGAALFSDAAWSEISRSLKLSKRELQITWGVFDNLTEGAIATDLGVSEHTIHEHLNRLYKKLRVTTRAQVVLRVVHELLFLTLSEASELPPICRNRANGRCPMQD